MNTADAPATPAPPRWLAWLLSLPIAAGVLLATWFCLVLDRLRLVQIGLAVLVGYLLLRALASRLRVLRAPVRVLGAGWYALALAAWSVLAYPAYVIAPAQTAALLAAVVIAFALEQSRRTRWPWGALVLLAAAAAAWRQWHPYLWLLPAVAAVDMSQAAAKASGLGALTGLFFDPTAAYMTLAYSFHETFWPSVSRMASPPDSGLSRAARTPAQRSSM